ncbi:HDOD domain-containing protein [Imhoffiella purpurea]|uniref:Putative signal transduction protein n=1 Tax=Imhoffiella purpurea TaxID=1249627 RepID=W9VBB1_9GAMM|nr:HDOD domain-containing protein [Imhoffiella purpurea]EXJ16863.1 Putative signal transduction protein [Imhoffiella purpurea]
MLSSWLSRVTADAAPEELPVLARTRRRLPRVLEDDLAPRRTLAMAIMEDPGLALRVLQSANAIPHRHFGAELFMLEDAAHMLGCQRLLGIATEASQAEEVLDANRLEHYRRSAGRAVLAALLAQDWARIDRDRFPSEVSLAALLNNLGELYLLAHGDARMARYLEMVEVLHIFPHEAEYMSLGESLEELGHVLAVRWGLPEMVREAMRARNAQHLRTLCVMLATQTARYAFAGWRHPSQFTDLRLAAEMLDMDIASLIQRVNQVLDDFNRIAANYGVSALSRLPIHAEGVLMSGARPTEPTSVCLAPRRDDYLAAEHQLKGSDPMDRGWLLTSLLRGLHRGLGLNRVVFASYSDHAHAFRPEYLAGTDFEPAFNRFTLSVAEAGCLGDLMQRPASLWLSDENAAELLPRLPRPLLELIGVERFFVKSLWVGGRPVGIVHADRRTADCRLDAAAYDAFRRLVDLAGDALERRAA